jgi:hypothetical protein
MKNLVWAIVIFAGSAYGHIEPEGNLGKHGEILSQVKIEKGSILILDQVAREKNIEGNYLLTFYCPKNKKQIDCKLIKFDGTKRSK